MRLLSCLLMTFAAHAAPASQPVVEVFLPSVFRFEMVHAFHAARSIVDEIYSEIGVRVVWRPIRSAPDGCVKQPMHVQIVVAMQPSVLAGQSAEALAFANPDSTKGACVTLLMDQLNPAVKRNPLGTGFLLGHVLAHEMGHVLQGVARHSETGVMKRKWSLHETANMWGHERLSFTEYDAQLILDPLMSAMGAPERVQESRADAARPTPYFTPATALPVSQSTSK